MDVAERIAFKRNQKKNKRKIKQQNSLSFYIHEHITNIQTLYSYSIATVQTHCAVVVTAVAALVLQLVSSNSSIRNPI